MQYVCDICHLSLKWDVEKVPNEASGFNKAKSGNWILSFCLLCAQNFASFLHVTTIAEDMDSKALMHSFKTVEYN